jgi:biotin carboxyl carrier protein
MGFGPIVQEVVRGLPEKYRAVVVLCYWQGVTHEQAAAQLGCPLGTVRSRLARARNLLRRRLIRRGLAPLAAIVVAGLDHGPATASGAVFRLAAVPPELVRSTIQAAVRFSVGQVPAQIVSGLAASLVQSVLWSMTMIKIKVILVSVVLAGLVGTGGWFAALNGPVAKAQADLVQKAAPTDEKAKSASSQKVYSLRNGQATIRTLIPDGSRVKKGDLVCELDSASLRDQLVNQQITLLTAKATYENAKLEREVAEISVVEYGDGIFRSEDAETAGDVNIAEAELALAEAERNVAVNAAKALGAPGSDVGVKHAELAVLRARFALEKAVTRRKTLLDFTRGKMLKALKSSVAKARSSELAQKSIEELQAAKLKGLERQIASCKIAAPRDGTIVYAPRIFEGGSVREGQVLFEIVPSPETKAEIR